MNKHDLNFLTASNFVIKIFLSLYTSEFVYSNQLMSYIQKDVNTSEETLVFAYTIK